MKKLTWFSVKYPVSVSMIILGILVLGYISYDKLNLELFPNLQSPRIFVEIKAGERPPEEIEKQYVENIEALAIRQRDVVQVYSVSRVGSAQITIEYAWNKDMDEAYLDIQKALSTYNQDKGIDQITITQHDPNAEPIMLIAMNQKNGSDLDAMRRISENYIRNEMVRLEGVADLKTAGTTKTELLVTTDQYRMKAFNLTADDISQKIQSAIQNVSGGRITESGVQYIIKGVSGIKSPSDFENIIVGFKQVETNNTFTEKAPIFLKEVARVEVKEQKPINIVKLNGKRCIGLSIYKETRFNTVKAIEQIEKKLKEIQKTLSGYQFTIISNQGRFIKSAVGEVRDSALIGMLLAVFVLFVFLRRIGSTLIVSISMPISIIATFTLMYFSDLSLNIMTLGGLALGAGMLVDNAIVVLENMFRLKDEGSTVEDAAINGTAQVGNAITASTITTIVVFLPIVYLHGESGALFKDQAWTVTFSLLSSLFVAILVMPMFFHRLYRKSTVFKKTKSLQFVNYPGFLEKVLNHRNIILVLTLVLLGSTYFMIPLIGTEFMPKTDSKEFEIELKMPEGTTLERTASATENLENIINELYPKEVKNIYCQIGPAAVNESDTKAIFKGESSSSIKIILDEESNLVSNKMIETINKAIGSIPGVELGFKQDETSLKTILGTDKMPVSVEVSGENLDQLERYAELIKEKMQNVSSIYNIQTTTEAGSPEVEVVVDRVRANMFNLTTASIISQIKDQLEGKNSGQFEYRGEIDDITIRMPDVNLSELGGLKVRSGSGEYRLDEVAVLKQKLSPREILHRNQTRVVRIDAQLQKNLPLDKVAKEIESSISEIGISPDYRVKITGEEEKRDESMKSLGFALMLSILLVYMVMASQFESFIHPFIILFTVPMAVSGSIITFLIIGKPLNIMALIGIIMLVGIAVNNAIILVDRINQLIGEGYQRRNAILTAAGQRIRPILMTSLTTILALIPLTVGFGDSSALRAPMAWAVIGGLTTSTILSLIIIPCFYDLLGKVTDYFHKG